MSDRDGRKSFAISCTAPDRWWHHPTPSHRNGADNRLGRHSPNLYRLRRTRLRVGAAADRLRRVMPEPASSRRSSRDRSVDHVWRPDRQHDQPKRSLVAT